MKKLLLSLALVCFGVSAMAQESAKQVNQYGQEVKSLPIEASVQDGILVLQNKQANYKMWFDVRLQADAAIFFDEPGYADKIGNGMSLRRTRFAVKAQLDKNWYGEFDTDWTSGVPEIKDAIIAYTGLKGFEFKVGNFKENFSIQRNTTSRYLVFMERPMVTSLAPSRHLGFNVRYASKYFWASAGIFGPALKDAEAMEFMQDYNKDYGMNEGLSYTGKVVFRPINTPDASLHIGAAFSYRNPKTTEFKVKDFEELIEEDEDIIEAIEAGKFSELDVFGGAMDARNSTDINRKKYVNSGDLIGLDYETAWTVELAGHHKGLRYEAAYIARTAHMNEEVVAVAHKKNPFSRYTGDGWYVQGSYMLFGGTQSYDSKGAKYNRTTSGRNWGDLELAARYQTMDLNDAKFDAEGKHIAGITGGKARMWELGLNYYPMKNVKIMLNWALIDQDKYANGKGVDKGKFYVGYDKNGEPTKNSSKVVGKGGVDYQMLSMRFQVAF